MEWFQSRIRRSPQRALVVGKIVFLAGCILVVGAVFARAAIVSLNTERANIKQPALQTLTEAYPQYPTWVVPEGPVGFSISALLILVGMALTLLAGEAVKTSARGRGV
jgi:hypothetical protein